ncbi:hypothetical protein [Deinococcus cellulosilyticus]|uniref:Translocation and assembly module TamB C-terminal domain-containing protein n=1 Tax=Deinococcus cellulosilyticus (strain DSM 18568 / NBRC 106333 / KACC 11606 / 5516J-15) TaxID=1223518 RepID=A0A511MWC7_DEIC1|nr:hypothetical protein [Deinococcus cellulosilyticus]GEM44882.1 hypothetical protein DC3_05170 [Deinococcus cellulosilyticus NBRC 106333 = KACC 11606]
MWRRILGWGTLGLVLLLVILLGLLVSPVGLRLVLNFVQNSGTHIEAQGIRGWLWDFTLQDVRYSQPGVKAQAQEARIQLGLSEIFAKTIHIRAALKKAHIDLDPSKLEGGGEGTWQTQLDALQVEQTTLSLNGTPINVPDAELSLTNQSPRTLQSQIKTRYGKLNAVASFDPGLSNFKVDFKGDASILKHYYPGIQSGLLEGTYSITPDNLQGDVQLSEGRVHVPEFKQVDATGIHGTLHHEGDLITADLSGQALGGPVRARAAVDLKKERWDVVADGTPQLKSLDFGGLGGQGKLHIETGGWEKVTVKARYAGSVTLQDLQVPDAEVSYRLTEKLQSFVDATGQASGYGQSALLKASLQNLGKFWTGDATLQGENITAKATLEDQLVRLRGQAFKVNLNGNYRLDDQTLQATAQTNLKDLQENLRGQLNVQARGTLDRLNLSVVNSELDTDITGPLSLNGQGSYQDGVLNLSTRHLDLGYQSSGATWALRDVPIQGVGTIDGVGNLRGETLLGTVGIQDLPADAEPVRGELTLNTRTLDFSLLSSKIQASGKPEDFKVTVKDYTFTGGVRQTVRGTLQIKDFSPSGTLRLQSEYQDVTATLSGLKATLKGTLLGPLKGLPVAGTADLERARLDLGGILADVQYQPLKATLTQQNRQLQVNFADGKWNASGSLPLDTVQKAFNLPVNGTLAVNLVNSRGTAEFTGSYQESAIQAQLNIRPDLVTGQLQVEGEQFRATAQGQVYPNADLRGTLTALDTQSAIRVHGPFGALKFQASGSTPAFVREGLVVASKPFRLQGNLTPAVTGSGTVGGLQVKLQDLEQLTLSVTGQETVDYQGAPYTLQLSGTWNPDWAGKVTARLQGPRLQASLRGPWKNLTVDAAFRQQDLNLRARAQLDASSLKYSGSVAATYRDLRASGTLQGTQDRFRVGATVFSPEKGTAQIQVRGLNDIRIQASNFVYQDISASGNLRYSSGKINGVLGARYQDNRLSVNALGETFTASLSSPYGAGTAQGKLDFSQYQVQLKSNYLTGNLQGNLEGLTGTLTTVRQSYQVLNDLAEIPAQTFTLKGNYQQGRFTLSQDNEEVLYLAGQLSGGLTLSYALRDAGTGQVRVSPTLQRVNAEFTGLISGQARLYPDVQGSVNAPFSLVTRLLPEPYRNSLTPGRIQADISGPYERLTIKAQTSGTLWEDQALSLQGSGFWTPRTYQASLRVVHPLADLQGQITPEAQTFEGTVDAALVPELPEGLTGKATLKGSLKDFDVQTLTATGTVVAAYQDVSTDGTFQVTPGLQVQTDLKGTALQKTYALQGRVYPQVQASLRFDQAQGTATGTYDSLSLALKGQLFDQEVDLRVQTREQTLTTLQGTVDGGELSANLDLASGQGTASIRALDLKGIADVDGKINVQATLNSFKDATLQASGTVQNIQLNGNFRWFDGLLSASALEATLPQGTVTASGPLYPDLNLRGSGTLQDPVQVPLTFEASGELQKPLLKVQATLPEAYEGLQLGASRAAIEVRDLKNIQVQLTGAVEGTLLGTYQDQLTLQKADLRFNLPIQREEATGKLTGTLAWDGAFRGNLQFAGQVAGEQTTLQATGNGDLDLIGSWQNARFQGSIQRDIFKGLNAKLSVPEWNLSPLLGLNDPLVVGATATVSGPWSDLSIQGSGQLRESKTGQSVQFSVKRAQEIWEAVLSGAIQGTAHYSAEGWNARLTTENLNAGAFVPQLKQGTLTGNFVVSGHGTSLTSAQGSGLRIAAVDQQDNPIALQGSATYTSGSIQLALQGSYANAPVRVSGAYPEGIEVDVQNFKIAEGTLNLSGTVSGDFSNPDLKATGSFSHLQGTAQLDVSGQLQDLLVRARATLTGDATGTVAGEVQVKNLDLNALVLDLNADVQGAGVLARGTLKGTYPAFTGQMQLLREGAYVTLTGNGDGSYRLSDSNVVTGTVSIQGLPPKFSGDVTVNAVPLLKDASGSTQLQVNFSGDLDAIRATYSGTLSSIRHQDIGLTQATVQGSFTGPYAAPEIQLTTQLEGARYQEASVQTANLTVHSRGAYLKPTLEASGTLKGVKYGQDSLDAVTFSGTHQGDFQSPTIHLKADLKGLQYQDTGLEAGQIVADHRGSWQNPTLHLTGDLTGLRYQDVQLQTAQIDGDYSGIWPEPDLHLVAEGSGFTYQDAVARSSTLRINADYRASTRQLVGSLSGQINGVQFKGDQLESAVLSGNLKGTLAEPDIHVETTVGGLKYQGDALEKAVIVADSRGALEKPSIQLKAELGGVQYQGDALQSASIQAAYQGEWAKPTLKLTGTLGGIKYQDYHLQSINLTADHQGEWAKPTLQVVADGTGFVYQDARVQTFKLNGNTRGDLSAPDLNLNTTLTGVTYQEGSAQQVQLTAHLQGPLTTAQVGATGSFAGLNYQDVQTADGAFTVKGTVDQPQVALSQGGQTTLVYQQEQANFSGFTVNGFDHQITLSGSAGLKTGNLKVNATGPFTGQVEGQYQQTQPLDFTDLSVENLLQSYNFDLRHQVKYQGYEATGRASVTDRQWSGTGTVSGLPSWLSGGKLDYRLAGQNLPTLYSTVKGYGLQADLKLDTTQATLQFVDTPDLQARGSLTYTFAESTFSGSTAFQKDTISITLAGTGKTLEATLKQAETTVNATATLDPLSVEATFNDGVHTGTARYTEEGWVLNIPTFEVGSLDGDEFQGTFSLTGSGKGTTGTLDLQTTGLRLPFTIPVLEEKIQGDLTARVVLGESPTATASYRGPLGTASLSLSKGAEWTGALTADLHTTSNPGSLKANLQLQQGQVQGQILVNQFGYTYRDLKGFITGQVDVKDSQFAGTLQTRVDDGVLNLEAEGGLADVIPALEALGIQPSDEGYLVTASASAFPLEKLKLLPYARGRVYGTATFTSDSSTVNVRIPDLSLPGSTPAALEIAGLTPGGQSNGNEPPRTILSTRLDGTFSNGDARFRGSIGDTSFVGSSTDGVLVGTIDFRNTPLHALIGAFTDSLPGQGLLTGTGRIDGKLSELDQLKLSVVAESIKVTSAGQTLSGSGQFSLEQGALTIPGIQLAGAGSLLIQGIYAPGNVNLTADFRDTTFTPLLALVPSLKDYKPSLKGNLSLKATGQYEQPTIELQGNNLQGELAGIGIQLNQLVALLQQNQLTLQSDVGTTGTVTSALKLQGKASLQDNRLQDAQLDANGNLNIKNFGTLEGTSIRLNQQGDTWKLLLTGTRGGKFQATGNLYPDLNVRIQLDDVQPDLENYYIENSSVNGVLNLVQSGGFYRLSGDIDLERLQFTLSKPVTEKTEKDDTFVFESPLPTEYTTFPQQRQDQDRSALANWIFDDITIDAKNNIRIDENLARAEFGGQLVLSGNAYTPRLQGDVLPKRGSVFLRENEFVLNPSTTSIRFSAADGVYPNIRLEGIGNVRDEGRNVRVIMTITGTFVPDPEDPRLRTFAPVTDIREEREVLGQCADPVRNPNSNLPKCLDEASLYSLLVFGTKDIRNLPTELTQSAIRTTLQVFLLGEVERSIEEALGIDVFRIRNYTIGEDQKFNAEFTVGTYLSREWYIQYQVDLLGNGNVEVQYNALDGRLSLTFSSPLNRLDFNTVQPEFSLAYNIDPQNSIELGISTEQNTQGDRGFSVKFGYKLRF